MLANRSIIPPQVPGSSLSQDAEKMLITRILEEPYFKELGLRRLLATYIFALEEEKNVIISEVMQKIWNDKSLVDAFKHFDFILSISGMRGHYVHQFEVFMLGLNFIFHLQDTKKAKLDKFGFKEDINQVIYTWLLASAAHDFGYPIEKGNLIIEKLAELYAGYKFDTIAEKFNAIKLDELIKTCPEFAALFIPDEAEKDSVSLIVREGIAESLNPSAGLDVVHLQKELVTDANHGYTSSIMICKRVLEIIQDKYAANTVDEIRDKAEFKSLKYALGAVALHSLKEKKPEEKRFLINMLYELNPYAYLLFIFDNIQDWSRTLSKSDKYAEYFLQSYSLRGNVLKLDYHLRHDTWSVGVFEEVIKHVDEMRKNLEALSAPNDRIGIKFFLNFYPNNGQEVAPIEVEY